MKILLADDHILFRAGLVLVLRQLTHSVEVVEAGSCSEMLSAIDTHPDIAVVLLDLRMPDGDGLVALMQRRLVLPVVVLSASEKREDMQRALRTGAAGFMPKTIQPEVMLNGLRLVLAGGTYVPPEMVDTGPTNSDAAHHSLTPRQLEVL